MLGEGHYRPRKVQGAVPHDVGSPSEDPFVKTNIYNFQVHFHICLLDSFSGCVTLERFRSKVYPSSKLYFFLCTLISHRFIETTWSHKHRGFS